jgi:transposase
MIRGQFDSRELDRKLKTLSKDLNKTAEQTVTEIAQIGAKQLAYRMQPWGLNEKAKKVSENAVNKDINRAYDYIGQTYNTLRKVSPRLATAYAVAAREGNFTQAEKYARRVIADYKMRSSDAGAAHLDSVRGRRGRVPSTNTNVMGIKSNSEIDNIKVEMVERAGYAKAGWLQAGKNIRAKARIPSWLVKSERLGYGTIMSKGWGTVVTLTNLVTYVSNLLTGQIIANAQAYGIKNQVSKMQRAVNRVAKKF